MGVVSLAAAYRGVGSNGTESRRKRLSEPRCRVVDTIDLPDWPNGFVASAKQSLGENCSVRHGENRNFLG
jgi:hypothetical protein